MYVVIMLCTMVSSSLAEFSPISFMRIASQVNLQLATTLLTT